MRQPTKTSPLIPFPLDSRFPLAMTTPPIHYLVVDKGSD
jgi:hypothetical protein